MAVTSVGGQCSCGERFSNSAVPAARGRAFGATHPYRAPCVVGLPKRFLYKEMDMNLGKGCILWLIGIPIPVIILLWILFHR